MPYPYANPIGSTVTSSQRLHDANKLVCGNRTPRDIASVILGISWSETYKLGSGQYGWVVKIDVLCPTYGKSLAAGSRVILLNVHVIGSVIMGISGQIRFAASVGDAPGFGHRVVGARRP